MKNLALLLFVLLGFLWSSTSSAQTSASEINIGTKHKITSKILKEDRPYWVHVPEGYNPSGNPMPVMYLLDGAGHFHHTTGIVNFLARQNRMPNMIVVAIPNTSDRTRDLTPEIIKNPSVKQNFPTGGKADNMLAFIKDELIPHIDKSYHTSSYKMLIGHSFGGIFVVNSLLKEPDLFDSYISISPSMWWDDQSLVDQAEKFFAEKPDLDVFFYMTMGNEGGSMLGGAMKLAALFEEYNGEGFEWDFKVMEKETHGSVPHRSTYDGLEAIFQSWYEVDFAQLYSEGGMEAIDKHYAKIKDKLGYEQKADENTLNELGYSLMRRGNMDAAIEVFKKNVKDYPKSYNVYDSMAEAFMNNKDKTKAIEYYKKSLAIHPGNTNAVNILKDLGIDHKPEVQKLSKKQLSEFVGKYKMPLGILEVELEEGKLMASIAGGRLEKQAITPYPNDVFLVKTENVAVAFERNEKNEVTGFLAQQGIGRTMKGKKVSEM